LKWLERSSGTPNPLLDAVTEEEAITLIRSGGKAMDAGVKALYQGMAQQMLRFFTYRGLAGDEAKYALRDTFVNITCLHHAL
jgi:hypothetical protein